MKKTHLFSWGLLLLWAAQACTSSKSPQTTTPAAKDAVASTPAASPAGKPRPAWAAKKSSYKPSRTLEVDILDTKLEVSFDWSKSQMKGLATITLRPWFYAQNRVQLDAVGMEIFSVNLLKGTAETPLKYKYDGKVLDITLDKTYTRDQSLVLEIDYLAKPDEQPVGGSAAITQDKGLYFINPKGDTPDKPQQIWTQGETQANSKWFPTVDTPNERFTQTIKITVDTAYKTLSNGLLVGSYLNKGGTRTDVWEQKKPHAPYLAMMAVGKFAIVKDKWRNLDVHYYVEPEYAPYARYTFGKTPEMLEFFSTKLGVVFPWEKYHQVVVRDYVSGAMENTSASLFGEFVQIDNHEAQDQSWEGIVAHELFHQWFGDLVTCESWANLPLNESFANYSEYLWAEYKHGRDEADYEGLSEAQQYLAEARSKQEPLIRYYHGDKEEMFDAHSYAKGGRILHMLRTLVGDEAFFASLKLYLTRKQFSAAEVHDLRMAFEEVTGQDLNWFFNQWFLNAGHPRLEVRHTWQAGQVKLVVKQLQDSAYTPVYRLPVQIAVVEAGGKKTLHDLVVRNAVDTFTLAAASQPELVYFDAQTYLLATVDKERTEAEWAAQYNYMDRLIARLDAVRNLAKDPTQPVAKATLRQALSDKFWACRTLSLKALASSDSTFAEREFDLLKKFATTDPKSNMRADAMNLLGKTQNPARIAVLKQGLKDSSYQVQAAALAGYLEAKQPDASLILTQLENTRSGEILDAIGDYYAASGDTTKYDWFVKKIGNGSGKKAQVLPTFAKYLLKAPDTQRRRAATFLMPLAEAPNADFTQKIYSFQALVAVEESVPGLRDKLKAMVDAEKSRPIKMYMNVMLNK